MAGYLEEGNLKGCENSQIKDPVSGDIDLHEVTLSMNEAEASFELMMEIRNKLVDAYNDIMRMQA